MAAAVILEVTRFIFKFRVTESENDGCTMFDLKVAVSAVR